MEAARGREPAGGTPSSLEDGAGKTEHPGSDGSWPPREPPHGRPQGPPPWVRPGREAEVQAGSRGQTPNRGLGRTRLARMRGGAAHHGACPPRTRARGPRGRRVARRGTNAEGLRSRGGPGESAPRRRDVEWRPPGAGGPRVEGDRESAGLRARTPWTPLNCSPENGQGGKTVCFTTMEFLTTVT